jgi:hypothetical protein
MVTKDRLAESVAGRVNGCLSVFFIDGILRGFCGNETPKLAVKFK